MVLEGNSYVLGSNFGIFNKLLIIYKLLGNNFFKINLLIGRFIKFV